MELIPDGTKVEFTDPEDGKVYFGVVQNYVEPDVNDGWKGGYHIACYYVVSPQDVRVTPVAPVSPI